MTNNAALIKAKQKYLIDKSLPSTVDPNNILIQEDENSKNVSNANVLEKGIETVLDVGGNILGGAIKNVEGIVDYGLGIVGWIGGIFDDGFQNDVKKIIEYDFTQENIFDPLSELTKDSYINDASVKAQQIIRGISQGVGQMIPATLMAIPTGGASLVSTLTFGLGAAGTSVEEAFKDGANYSGGMLYGTASGVAETAIEKISGFVGSKFLGGTSNSGLNSLLRKKISSTVGRKLVKVGIGAISEGGEEVLSDIINPLLKLTYKDFDEIEMASFEDLLDSFIIGAGASLAYNGTIGKAGGKVSNIQENIDEMKYTKDKQLNKPNITEQDFNEYQKTMEDINIDISYDLKKIKEDKRQGIIKALEETGMNWFNQDGSIDYDKFNAGIQLNLDEDIKSNINFDINEVDTNTQTKIRETINMYNEFKKVNKNISNIMFDNTLKSNIDGFYNPKTKTLHINPNTKNPYKTILKHELTHSLESGKNYNEFKDYAISMLKQTGEYDTLKAEIQTKYKNELVKQSNVDEYIDQEIVANFSERLFEDEASIKNLVSEKRNIAQKIYDWIKEKLSILTGKSKEEIELKKQLRKAEKLFKNALEENNEIGSNKTKFKLTDLGIKKLSDAELKEIEEKTLNNIKNSEYAKFREHTEMVDVEVLDKIKEYDWLDLKWTNNTDREPDVELKKVVDSIKENGFKANGGMYIEYNPNNGFVKLSEGNHRLAIAKLLGIKKIPIIAYATKSGDTRYLGKGKYSGFYLNPNPNIKLDDTLSITELFKNGFDEEKTAIMQKKAKTRKYNINAEKNRNNRLIEERNKLELERIAKLTPEQLQEEQDDFADFENLINSLNEEDFNDDIRFKKNDAESTNEETKASKFQDKSVPNWALSEMVDEETQKEIESMKTYYVPETNKKTREYVDNTLKDLDKNYNTYIDNYINDIQNGRVMTKKDIAVGIELIKESVNRKDYDNYFKLSTNLTLLGSELGQQVQAFSLLKKLTPKGELYALEQWVKRHNSKDINKKKQLKIDETLRKELFNLDTKYKQATDEKTKNELKSKIDEISNKIKDDLANQLPVTFWDKLREWRYLSMLGNPKTHVRNFIGNTVMMPIRKLKNKIARIIENSAIKLGKMQVSERVHIGRKHIAQATIDFAKADAIEVIDRLAGGSKFNNQTDIYTRQKKFKFKPLEAFRKFNYSMLEKADMWALKKTYIETFSEYVTAKGYTITDLKTKPEILEEARIYAIEESQKATYREFSKFANYINKIKSENAIAGITLDALVPFAKTPINILKTGMTYSPLGLIKSVTYNKHKLHKGEININQYIESLSKGLTGSMIMALGMVLAKLGILKARVSDDDKEDKYLTDLGRQDYALEIAGKSYTLDWVAPASMPLFVGVVFQETLEEDDFRMGNIEGMVGAVASTADPLTDLSMLSSLNSTLQTYQDNKVSGMAKQMVKNFLAQHFPTLGSQIAKVIDPVKRTTASTNNTGNDLNKELNQYVNYLKSKVPFLSMQLEPYINVWGEEVRDENVINRALENLSYPFWVSEFNISSTVDNELTSLYKISGNNEIYPTTPRSYYTVDGQRYDMTSEEYTQYKIDYGKFSYSQLNSLFTSNFYKNLSYEEKENIIKNVYNYARDFARKGKYYELYQILKTNNNQDKLALYLAEINSIKPDYDKDGNAINNSKKLKVFKYINSLPLTKSQKNKLFEFVGYKLSNANNTTKKVSTIK